MAGKKTAVDLTQGNIYLQILLFSMPILLGQIFQNLYNSVDAVVVGQAVGVTGLAAVASSSDISMLITGFFVGFSTGASILFARYYGANNLERLHDSIHTGVLVSFLVGLAMAVIGIVFSPALLHIVKCPADVYDQAIIYLRIYLVGVTFTAIYNVGSGILRAVGDSKTPFYILVISSIVNIILDVLLVMVFSFGVVGAAMATIGSQLLSVYLVYHKLIVTEDVYQLNLKELHIDPEILKEIMNLGLPAGIQSSIISISNLFVQRYVNAFGSAALAGIGAAKKVDKFVGMVGQSLGLATASFVGQNVGAGYYDRAFKGIRSALIMAISFVLIIGVFLYIRADICIAIFTDDQEAMSYGIDMMRTMIPLYFCQSIMQVLANAVRGFGKSLVVMILSVSGMVLCRQIFLYISMSINYTVRNVYYAFPVGWFFAALFVSIYYFTAIRPKYKNQSNLFQRK